MKVACWLGWLAGIGLVLPGDGIPWRACAQDASRARHEASSSREGRGAALACDGDRFDAGRGWAGGGRTQPWWWQVDFGEPRSVGAILQVQGDHEFVLRNAPRDYSWEASDDGVTWRAVAGASCRDEPRLYRLHRLARAERARFFRIRIDAVHGEHPVLREVEFHPTTDGSVSFPEWVVAVNVTHDGVLPGHGQEFIPLARQASAGVLAQQVWLVDFKEAFVEAEPRPLCAFLSGSFKDWCEVERGHWRGVEGVLRSRNLPMWASCGGAQGLALVWEHGVDAPWDCPHCRDPLRPRSPIYTHLGHRGERALKCGDYGSCVFERGPFAVRQVGEDEAFRGLGPEFTVMESHCGQIAWVPKGWELVAAGGPESLTRVQCMRLKGFPVYAAQFHVEMTGTPDVSRAIMENFLRLARASRVGREPTEMGNGR